MPVINKVSPEGTEFIERHEGFVSKAYKDPVGVVTIGTGFTNGSKTAVRMLGKIKLGMTITREQNARVLQEALNEEYGPYVVKALAPTKQNHFDAALSTTFNVGPRVLEWKWAQAFKAGRIAEAAKLLKTTATTAKGKKLAGLVTRRREEADLLQFGDYGKANYPTFKPSPIVPVTSKKDPILAKYQEQLKDLGYYKGGIDGLVGPLTKIAVEKFQNAHPQLKVDGILGKATQAQLERIKDMKSKSATVPVLTGIAGAAVSSAITTYFMEQIDWTLVVGIGSFIVVAAAALGVIGMQYKDEVKAIKGKKNA